jgi:drug/metabolite transporter (DMT)-like permease
MTAAFARRSPAAVVVALATVYAVWGSTYLAIRITDRTQPPLLMSSVRFLIAGLLLYAFAARGGPRPSWREWRAAAIVGGALLLVGNGGVAWAETRIHSGLAALLVAMMPLWLAVLDRAFLGRRLAPLGMLGIAIGFGGVALLVRPGGGVDALAAGVLVVTTLSWAAGSLYARDAPLPSRPLVSAAMQMLAASPLLAVAGLAGGEASDVHSAAFSAKPLLAFSFLVLVGSLIGFTAYAWLIRNVRTSVVSTYAYVNPIVAVALGAIFLNESIRLVTLVAGAAIVLSVVLIIRARSAPPPAAVAEIPREARRATLAA